MRTGNPKKYVLHPGKIRVKGRDGVEREEEIDAQKLAALWNVLIERCYVETGTWYPGKWRGDLIHLYPMEDGNYGVPGRPAPPQSRYKMYRD